MKSLKSKIAIGVKHIGHQLNSPYIPRAYMRDSIPYVSQWESPELAEQIINGQLRARDDPKWRKSGARTRDEYQTYSWNMCGMACLRMILLDRSGKADTIIKLGKKCTKYGGYTLPFGESAGLQYRQFAAFMKSEYDIDSIVKPALLQHDIKVAISKGEYVIASVSPQIRRPDSLPQHKGGHLVLITGYDDVKRIFYLHNPSGIAGLSQVNTVISYRDFRKFFAHRGIIVKSK